MIFFLHLASSESFFSLALRSTPRTHSQIVRFTITFKIIIQSLFLSIVYVTYLYVSSPVKIYIAPSVPTQNWFYDVCCNLPVAIAFSLSCTFFSSYSPPPLFYSFPSKQKGITTFDLNSPLSIDENDYASLFLRLTYFFVFLFLSFLL